MERKSPGPKARAPIQGTKRWINPFFSKKKGEKPLRAASVREEGEKSERGPDNRRLLVGKKGRPPND